MNLPDGGATGNGGAAAAATASQSMAERQTHSQTQKGRRNTMATVKARPDRRKPVSKQTALELLASARWYLQAAGIAVRQVNTQHGLAIVLPGVSSDESGQFVLEIEGLPVLANAEPAQFASTGTEAQP